MDSMQNQDRLSFSAGWRVGDSQIKLGVFFCFFFTSVTPGRHRATIPFVSTPDARRDRLHASNAPNKMSACVRSCRRPLRGWTGWWLMSVRLGASGRGRVYSLTRSVRKPGKKMMCIKYILDRVATVCRNPLVKLIPISVLVLIDVSVMRPINLYLDIGPVCFGYCI